MPSQLLVSPNNRLNVYSNNRNRILCINSSYHIVSNLLKKYCNVFNMKLLIKSNCFVQEITIIEVCKISLSSATVRIRV